MVQFNSAVVVVKTHLLLKRGSRQGNFKLGKLPGKPGNQLLAGLPVQTCTGRPVRSVSSRQ